MLLFSKMHANGNDFVVFDGLNQNIDLNVSQRKSLCDRNYGIGCDQILVLLPPKDADSDFYCAIYNSDGSESGQCGNGMCAIAQFIVEQGLSGQRKWKIRTCSTLVHAQLKTHKARVALGVPQFSTKCVGFESLHQGDTPPYTIEYLGRQDSIHIAYVGNPHAIVEVEQLDSIPVQEWGSALSTHKRFAENINVSFVRYGDGKNISLRVFERGAGETLACGSAAAAAVAVGCKLKKLQGVVTVNMAGGTLNVEWPKSEEAIWIESQVHKVFTGQYRLMR